MNEVSKVVIDRLINIAYELDITDFYDERYLAIAYAILFIETNGKLFSEGD